jgi:hypothetical protein
MATPTPTPAPAVALPEITLSHHESTGFSL